MRPFEGYRNPGHTGEGLSKRGTISPARNIDTSGTQNAELALDIHNTAGATRFTVQPISEETVYCPVDDSIVDQRIADFSNTRRCRIHFTRVDNHDHYLYGRKIVQCTAAEDDVFST